ncbi:MAG: OsmC family protein [Rhodobacteraceae bacterium]|nr:OsmC family protein [Paracoccaceae bacterium]
MSQHIYTAEIIWRAEGDFEKGKYSRSHLWRFDGGVEVPASASPQVVPLPYSLAEAVDPEEAFVAAISSCHMMTFLDLARRAGLSIAAYEDKAEGIMERLARGRFAVTRAILRPKITFRATQHPDADQLAALHEEAHEVCFIANSVKTEIEVEPMPALLVSP